MKPIGRVNKKDAENFAATKQRKREKRTRFSPKKAKPGAFWVLEGMGTVENRGERMGKASNRAEGLSLACRLGRAWTQPTGLQAPTTRTAQGAAVPRCRVLMRANEK